MFRGVERRDILLPHLHSWSWQRDAGGTLLPRLFCFCLAPNGCAMMLTFLHSCVRFFPSAVFCISCNHFSQPVQLVYLLFFWCVRLSTLILGFTLYSHSPATVCELLVSQDWWENLKCCYPFGFLWWNNVGFVFRGPMARRLEMSLVVALPCSWLCTIMAQTPTLLNLEPGI